MLGIFYLYKLYISYHDNIYKFKIENGRGTKFFVDCYIVINLWDVKEPTHSS